MPSRIESAEKRRSVLFTIGDSLDYCRGIRVVNNLFGVGCNSVPAGCGRFGSPGFSCLSGLSGLFSFAEYPVAWPTPPKRLRRLDCGDEGEENPP